MNFFLLSLIIVTATTAPFSAQSPAVPQPNAGTHVAVGDSTDLGVGRLLVASRNLGDPNFAETVVLLVRYDADGVVGLVLNRRTDIPLSEALEGMPAAKDLSDPVYLGGPVDRRAVFALLRSQAKVEGADHVFDGVHLIHSQPLFDKTLSARPDPGALHVYVGYAGWSDAQLRAEVALGSWFILPADAKTVFDSDPDTLWPRMIHRTELQVAAAGPQP